MIHRTVPLGQSTAVAIGLAPALLLLCGLMLAAPAQAGPILTLIPPDGALQGLPGQTVGWGFELFNDQDYLVVTGADFPASLTIGTFIDYISAQFFVCSAGPRTATR